LKKMTEEVYDSFCRRIPIATLAPSYATKGLGVQQGSSDFIAPSLVLRSASDTPSVILISAPAAVGKTMLARQLSSDTKALYWNLAEFSLGSNFFVGTAVEHYGADGYSRFVKELKSGQRGLVLDAADEALVRAGKQNYVAAVQNLAKMISDSQAASVIIFGREDTIDDTAEVLTAQGVAVSRYAVAYFNRSQAEAFVKSKAEQRGSTVVQEFDAFLEKFFASVSLALGAETWDAARAFIGYAPVLDAVATFYTKAANPIRILESIRRSSDDNHVWELLVEIFERILTREQDKFAQNFGGDDAAKRDFGASAFTLRAQVSYLLNSRLDPEAFEFADSGDPEWLGELEDQIESQLREHPFRDNGAALQDPNPLVRFANSAFRDYVLAVGITDGELVHPLVLQAYWKAPSINPTPIFSGLLFAMADSHNRLLPASALGMIHDSHGAADYGSRAFMSTTSGFGGEDDETILTVRRATGALSDAPAVRVDASLQPPSFDRNLSNAFVDVWGLDVRLGDGFADFLIGPNVVMMADALHSLVPEIRVRSGASNLPVFLSISGVGGMTRAIAASPQTSLAIHSRSGPLMYPWHRHVIDRSTLGTHREAWRTADAMEMRQMFMWFSKPSMFGGGLRYPVVAVNALLGKNRVSAQLFDFLVEGGYVLTEREEYVLNLPMASTVIFKNQTSDQAYAEFLGSYAAWKQVQGITH
jgi:hypothetical protein